MPGKPIEYDRWKEDISLPKYALRCGYRLDEKKTGYGYFVLHKGEGKSQETLLVKRGHKAWIFVNNGTGKKGTILDFTADHLGVDLRTNEGWTAVCKELREEAGGSRPDPAPEKSISTKGPAGPDRAYVTESFDRTRLMSTSDYLKRRGLADFVLRSPRITGTWRVRSDGAVLFPHRDATGLCGFEVKAPGFSAFASRGQRALWHSNHHPDDRRLVVCESALDALSYFQLHPQRGVRLVSTGGAMSRFQGELLAQTVSGLHSQATLVIATDNDHDKPSERNAGRLLASQIAAIAKSVRPDISIELPIPPVGKDWNDVLQWEARGRPPLSKHLDDGPA